MRERNSENDFTLRMGIWIVEVKPGYARLEMDVKEWHYNLLGSIHGGVLFTLADNAGGVAAASHGVKMTTISSNFNFLAPGLKTSRLYAIAKEIKKGKHICVYDIGVFNDVDKLLAQGGFSYYSLGIPVERIKQ